MGKQIPLLIVGNWKMYKTAQEAETYLSALASQASNSVHAQIMLAVPFTAIAAASLASQKSKIIIGAQNMHDEPEGAFTGEISARMLKESGAKFVILGHSERRHYFNESNAFINRKVKRALSEGIMPLLCIGEKEDERMSGKTQQVLLTQLREGLEGLTSQEMQKIVIAYEPVWAIGTGKLLRLKSRKRLTLSAAHF